MAETFSVNTGAHEELIDITDRVNRIVAAGAPADGICIIYTPHTTAAITINENADPSVRKDILKGLLHLNFEKLNFAHMEGNSPAHLKSSLIGCSETVVIENGRLKLGTWQGVYFCEFDGPRTRQVIVAIL